MNPPRRPRTRPGREPGDARAPRRAAPAPLAPLPRTAWTLLVILTAAALIVLVTHRMWDPDLWQHLAVGRALWELKRVPHEQLWVWPIHGEPDVMPSWLFRALLWPFYLAGGVTGLFVWRWATTLAAFALLWRAARAAGRARGGAGSGPWALVALVWCGLFYRYRSQVRPETLVAVLIGAQLWLLERWRARGAARDAVGAAPAFRDETWALPLIALLWANAHISYYIGLALTGFYWLDARLHRRPGSGRLLVALVVSVAVSFVNPYGWKLLAQPFEYFFTWRHEAIYRNITELTPVDASAYATSFFSVWLPLVVGLALWGWWRRRTVDVAQLLTLAAFVPQALGTQRFLGYLAVLVAPTFARDLDQACEALAARVLRAPWARAGAAAALIVALPIPSSALGIFRPAIGIDWDYFPVEACNWIEAHDVRGRSFAPFDWGGYLLWRFWPQPGRLPFMDIHQAGTRADRDAMAFALIRADAWRFLDDERRFEWAVLYRAAHRNYSILNALDADTTWALVFADDAAALYLRRRGPLDALAERERYRLVPGGEAGLDAMIRRADADPNAAHAIRAELDRQIASSPRNGIAHNLRASVDLDERDWRGALADLDAAHRMQPELASGDDRAAIARDSLAAEEAAARAAAAGGAR